MRKRLIGGVLVALGMAGASLVPAFPVLGASDAAGSGLTLAEVRTKVDSWLAARWSGVVDRQESYAASHGGRYWQGLRTHVIEVEYPDGGDVDVVGDNLTAAPSDQAALFSVHAYDGPQGTGFVACVIVRYNGTMYWRCQNYGPETWRTFSWRILTY